LAVTEVIGASMLFAHVVGWRKYRGHIEGIGTTRTILSEKGQGSRQR